MKLGLYMDILNDMSFTEALDYAAGLGLDAVEIGTGNFSAAPHCQLDELGPEPGGPRRLHGRHH